MSRCASPLVEAPSGCRCACFRSLLLQLEIPQCERSHEASIRELLACETCVGSVGVEIRMYPCCEGVHIMSLLELNHLTARARSALAFAVAKI